MILKSSYKDLGEVVMPAWQGRESSMYRFDPSAPVMEAGFEDYEELVSTLVRAADLRGREAYMTIDEKMVAPQRSQRRPGAHVDGRVTRKEQRWSHYEPGRGYSFDDTPLERMAVIVTASVPGCIVYPGEFEGKPKDDGDLEHIRDQLGEGHLLPANRGFLLSPDCVHESKAFAERTRRSFLRIAFETAVVSSQWSVTLRRPSDAVVVFAPEVSGW